jgi:ATP-dependent Clp protease adaptor protein ClpS
MRTEEQDRSIASAFRAGPEPGDPGDGRGEGGSREGGTSLVVEEASPKLKKPPLFQVVLLNDDYTPMEFVVDVLQRIFGMDRTKATRVMLEVHTKGKGVCGVYTFEIAETKVAQVTAYARQHQHPLLCTMEET